MPGILEIGSRSIDFILTCFSLNVLTGLIPAFLIAGGINVFVPQSLVLKFLGARTNKLVSYSIATLAGLVLAV
jgi:uncharacterized protein